MTDDDKPVGEHEHHKKHHHHHHDGGDDATDTTPETADTGMEVKEGNDGGGQVVPANVGVISPDTAPVSPVGSDALVPDDDDDDEEDDDHK